MRGADVSDLLAELHRLLASSGAQADKAQRAAQLIRKVGGYRWVGLYTVGSEEIGVIGWDGPSAPACPTFPVTHGLNGAAVASGEPVLVQDVTRDSRYLSTLASTRAEMIVPIHGGSEGVVVGTIDVESDRVGSFAEHDRQLLSACAGALAGLWPAAGR